MHARSDGCLFLDAQFCGLDSFSIEKGELVEEGLAGRSPQHTPSSRLSGLPQENQEDAQDKDHTPCDTSCADNLRETGSSSFGDTPSSLTKQISSSGPKSSIRVETSRVDELMDLVGELAIAQSMLSQSAQLLGGLHSSPFFNCVASIDQLAHNIQMSVMNIRAQPVQYLFRRMTRVIRESMQQTGKDVVLSFEGENIEVDKVVVDRLLEPLTHLIRNAVDHGIERPAERQKLGKPPLAQIRLSAKQDSDRIQITVSDDGAGINVDKVRMVAVERGIIGEHEAPSSSDLYQLVFLPGFSTNCAVTPISGRGVGLDVVHRQIKNLRGSVHVNSKSGNGCEFTVTVPLSLFAIEGMIVRSNEKVVVIPSSVVSEAGRVELEIIPHSDGKRKLIVQRGVCTPVYQLGALLDWTDEAQQIAGQDTAVLYLKDSLGNTVALIVDEILGQRQVIVKGSASLSEIVGVSGATIAGDGRIMLIIDPIEMIHTYESNSSIEVGSDARL